MISRFGTSLAHVINLAEGMRQIPRPDL